MARKTVQEAADKWAQRVSGSQAYYTAGISKSADWAGNAVAAADARNAGLQAAIADGRIDRGILALGTTNWRNKTLHKGPANWLQGVTNAKPQYSAGMSRVFGYFDRADNAVSNMPRDTFAARMQRMQTFLSTVHTAAEEYKSTGR